MNPMNEDVVPADAWTAADEAFDEDPVLVGGDELSRALIAASPHMRRHELDRLTRTLNDAAEDVRNFGLRGGLRKAISIIAARKHELEQTT